jgi:WXXGXW repeat (2 copies)
MEEEGELSMIVITSLIVSLVLGAERVTYHQDDNDSYFGKENNAYNEDYVLVPSPPPIPRVEQPPLPPDPSYVWTPGYWRWEDDHWRWIGGEWIQPPDPGAKWRAGFWEKREDGWVWRKGRWRE